MGACLEPTSDMGTWNVEVRRESAYLNGDTLVHRGHGFAFPDGDSARVVAALDQIATNSTYESWLADHTPSDGGWSTETTDGYVRLYGAAIVYGGHDGPWTSGSVELPYEHLAGLRQALTGVPTEALAEA